jgi:hypothetical protein
LAAFSFRILSSASRALASLRTERASSFDPRFISRFSAFVIRRPSIA